jgi:outer membrane murein-binding lipoprotein Lpp
MKRFVVIIVLAALALTGCASGSFLGLATTGYVDEQTKAVLDQQSAQIQELKAQIADYESMKKQAQSAIEQMNATEKTIEDLQALAKRAESRISTIPREVIKQIVDILQSALSQ